MAWDESFVCDICGITKLESNHWWLVKLGEVPCLDEGERASRFILAPWSGDESRNPDVHHICGEGCATKALERYMSFGSLASDASKIGVRQSAESRLTPIS